MDSGVNKLHIPVVELNLTMITMVISTGVMVILVMNGEVLELLTNSLVLKELLVRENVILL
jgi:hypothetical protein